MQNKPQATLLNNIYPTHQSYLQKPPQQSSTLPYDTGTLFGSCPHKYLTTETLFTYNLF